MSVLVAGRVVENRRLLRCMRAFFAAPRGPSLQPHLMHPPGCPAFGREARCTCALPGCKRHGLSPFPRSPLLLWAAPLLQVGMKCVALAGRQPVYELGAADLVVRDLSQLSFVNLKQLFAAEERVAGQVCWRRAGLCSAACGAAPLPSRSLAPGGRLLAPSCCGAACLSSPFLPMTNASAYLSSASS